MSEAMKLIRELEYIGQNPKKSILASMKETGKKAVGCCYIYTPEELVYAAGMLPVGMWGGQTKGTLSNRYLQGFCCSIMKVATEQALLGKYDFLSAVIITSFCDTLKCIIENWKTALPKQHIIPMIYPQNRKIQAGKDFMKEELERVKVEMEKIAVKEITEAALEQAVDIYDEYRSAMQEFTDLIARKPGLLSPKSRHAVIKAAYFMDKKIYTEKIRRIIQEIDSIPAEKSAVRRIILTGLLAEPDGLLDIMAENQMVVTADDLAQESRQFRTIAPKQGDALQRMTERIAMQDSCAFLYDEGKTRGAHIIDLVKKYDADAVIFLQLKFCDPEEFDYPIIKKELEAAGIPLLYLEIEQQMDSLEQLRTRIQSFGEMLG